MKLFLSNFQTGWRIILGKFNTACSHKISTRLSQDSNRAVQLLDQSDPNKHEQDTKTFGFVTSQVDNYR